VSFISNHRVKFIAAVFLTLILVGAGWLFFFGVSEAAQTANVAPRVTVSSTGSFSITNLTANEYGDYHLDFGDMAAGGSSSKNMTLTVTANDNWQITVYKSRDLKKGDYDPPIPSENFTFTSSSLKELTYKVDTPLAFSAQGTCESPPANPDNVASGSAGNFDVTVTYYLTIPETQPAGSYGATHYYTLIMP
jgi:hypothetical protein